MTNSTQVQTPSGAFISLTYSQAVSITGLTIVVALLSLVCVSFSTLLARYSLVLRHGEMCFKGGAEGRANTLSNLAPETLEKMKMVHDMELRAKDIEYEQAKRVLVQRLVDLEAVSEPLRPVLERVANLLSDSNSEGVVLSDPPRGSSGDRRRDVKAGAAAAAVLSPNDHSLADAAERFFQSGHDAAQEYLAGRLHRDIVPPPRAEPENYSSEVEAKTAPRDAGSSKCAAVELDDEQSTLRRGEQNTPRGPYASTAPAAVASAEKSTVPMSMGQMRAARRDSRSNSRRTSLTSFRSATRAVIATRRLSLKSAEAARKRVQKETLESLYV